ncbi:uncharacterized protein LOC124166497 [Ischnura elegans]|uniref:uncharacterized protein LOC124166497 n=1 Tax=Ischnura elegans TaxID=197161 RepID=UPI001ED885CF|nr:uncharacterized protein LOC124166497 [Ischnura elegans]
MITKRERLLGKVVQAIGKLGPGASRKELIKYLERAGDAQDIKTRHYGVALRNAVDCGLVQKLKGRYSLLPTAEDGCGRRGRSRRRRSRSGKCEKKCKICRNKLGVIIKCSEKKKKKSKGRCGKRRKSRGRSGKGKRSGSRCGKRKKRRRSRGRCGRRGRR